MPVLLQISDTHFGTEVPPVVDALLGLAKAQKPSLVILSGDITQRARRKQFAAAQRFMAELTTGGIPTLVVPGNHDIPLFNLPARFIEPYANYTEWFGRTLEPCYESDELLVIGVNSTRWFRRKHGEVSHEQVVRVAEQLRAARREQLRVVVTHQPLQVIKGIDFNNLIRGHVHAALTWNEAGADIFMGGHIHLPYIRRLGEDVPGLPRESWVVQAGTATSKRIREGVPNSVNLVRYGAACVVERWDYAAAIKAFHQKSSETLPLSRTGEPSAKRTGVI
ncbi:MAG: metallophosphoesterase [Polyangiales bacterium]